MIKAYLAAIPTLYEGEDVEVRYSIFQDMDCIRKETIYLEYLKPALVGQNAVLKLLQKLKEYKEEEIQIIIHDASLYEVLKGTSTTEKKDVLKLADKVKKRLEKFKSLSFLSVAGDKEGLEEWKRITI